MSIEILVYEKIYYTYPFHLEIDVNLLKSSLISQLYNCISPINFVFKVISNSFYLKSFFKNKLCKRNVLMDEI